MKTTKSHNLVAAMLIGFAAQQSTHAADDQTNMVFEEGTVHIFCRAPVNADNSVFLETFPKLINNLQIHANEGRVVRAHYLKELKDGIFIIVGGDTRAEAIENADQLLAEQKAILDQAMKDLEIETSDSDDTCRILEVGPVAVLPNN